MSHEPWALVLGALGAALSFVSIGVASNATPASVGVAALVIASLLNVWFRIRQLHHSASHRSTQHGR